MANRHLSRSIVLQTLFEWDFNDGKNFDVKEVCLLKSWMRRTLVSKPLKGHVEYPPLFHTLSSLFQAPA